MRLSIFRQLLPCLLLLPAALPISRANASDALRLDPSRTWTLPELVELGRGRNAGLIKTGLAVEGLRWERMAALGRLLPTVSAGASYGRSERHVFTYEDPNGDVFELDDAVVNRSTGSNLNLSLSQTLFAGFANTAAWRRAQLAEQDVLDTDSRQFQQFRHDLRKAAHAVMAVRTRQGTEAQLLDERRRQLELARMRLQVGKGTELDVLQMEIDVGRQQVNVEAAEQELRSAWNSLALVLGAEPGEPGGLELDFNAFEPSWDVENLTRNALESREDLRSGRRGLEEARLQSLEARAGFLPSLSLRVGHSRSEQRSGEKGWEVYPRNYDNSASLDLQIPLFQGFSTLNTWQGSRIQERRVAVDVEQNERMVRAQIHEALLQLKSAWSQSRLTESNLDLARRSLDMERERYQLGLSSLLQVQSAEATWRQAENDHLAKRLAFRDRLAELELAVGRELSQP